MERPLGLLVGGSFLCALNADEARTLLLSAIFQIALTIGVFAMVPLRRWSDRRRSRARKELCKNCG